jgi:hypothetical protein
VDDVVKCLLAGADAVMTTSSLLRDGIDHMSTLTNGLRQWMEKREIASVAEMRGMMSWQGSVIEVSTRAPIICGFFNSIRHQRKITFHGRR